MVFILVNTTPQTQSVPNEMGYLALLNMTCAGVDIQE